MTRNPADRRSHGGASPDDGAARSRGWLDEGAGSGSREYAMTDGSGAETGISDCPGVRAAGHLVRQLNALLDQADSERVEHAVVEARDRVEEAAADGRGLEAAFGEAARELEGAAEHSRPSIRGDIRELSSTLDGLATGERGGR